MKGITFSLDRDYVMVSPAEKNKVYASMCAQNVGADNSDLRIMRITKLAEELAPRTHIRSVRDQCKVSPDAAYGTVIRCLNPNCPKMYKLQKNLEKHVPVCAWRSGAS